MNRSVAVIVAVFLLSVVSVRTASAAAVYILQGTATGNFAGGSSFGQKEFTITVTGDANVHTNLGAIYILPAAATIAIDGIGTATFTQGLGVDRWNDNLGYGTIGFYDGSRGDLIMAYGSSLYNYDLKGSLGPIDLPSGVVLSQFTAIPTSLGALTITSIGASATFSGNPPPQPRASQPALESWGGQPKISAGTWVELYGSDLGGTARTWTEANFQGGTAPVLLDGVSVLIDDRPAFLSYVSPTQVDVQVPNIAGDGDATIVITRPGGVRSVPITVPRAPVTPALLAPPAFKAGATQYVAANFPDLTTFVGQPGLVADASFRPAKPGDLVILYAVGCGPTSPKVDPGQVPTDLATLTLPVQVTVGGQSATIRYAGIYPRYIGLYRFDIVIPTVAARDQPVELSVDSVPTGQTVFLTIGQ